MSSGERPADAERGVQPLLRQQPAGDDDRQPRQEEQVAGPGNGEGFSWLTAVGFLFLTFNSGMAIYRSQDDPWAIAFVLFSYGVLTLLFACLRMYDNARPDSPRRDQLKVSVWLLTTMLTAAFSYKVAAIMPFPVAMLIWSMAFFTVAGAGFYVFSLHTKN